MRNLTEFEKGQIVRDCMAGASVTKRAELLGFSRASTTSRTNDGIQEARKTLQQSV